MKIHLLLLTALCILVKGHSQTITINQPTSSSVWHMGINELVQWNWSGSISTSTNIRLYKNGVQVGATQPVTSTTGINNYSFPVPTGILAGNDFYISIVVVGVTNAQSPNFTVTSSGTVTVSDPTSQTTWCLGSSGNVGWNWSGSSSVSTSIKLLKNGIQVGTTQTTTGNPGSNNFLFPIPTGSQAGSDYYINVSAGGSGNSSPQFTITTCGSVTISLPNSSSSWCIGGNGTVTWNWTGSAGSTTQVKLFKSGVQAGSTQNTTSNNGSNTFPFPVPTGILTGSDYYITVSCGGSSVSSSQFAVSSCGNIVLSLPNSSSTWCVGSTGEVAWLWSGSSSVSTEIKLLKSGVQVGSTQTVTSSPGSNSFSFPVLSGSQTGSDYYITVSAGGSSVPSSLFTINSCGNLSISQPNTTSTWCIGSTGPVAWTWSGSSSASTAIKLFKSGVQVGPTQTTTSAVGSNSMNFPIPSGSQTGNDYNITITAGGSSVNSALFTLSSCGNLTVSAPNSNSVWFVGQNSPVTWNWSGITGSTTEIRLFKSSAQVGTTQTTTSNTGTNTFLFPVPASIQTGTDYRVSISVPGSSSIYSDYFTMTNVEVLMAYAPSSMNFGNVSTGQSGTIQVTFNNLATSSGNLVITPLVLSAPFSHDGSGSYTLIPGQSKTIHVTFSPTSSGNISQNWSVSNTSTNQPNTVIIALSGIGGQVVNMTVVPSSLAFGSVQTGQTATQTVHISNESTSTGLLTLVPDLLTAPFTLLNGSSISLNPGQSTTYSVSFQTPSASSYNQNWSIANNATNQSHPKVIPVSGTGVQSGIFISVQPASVDFGTISAGQTSIKSVTIKNEANSSGPFSVTPGIPSFPFTILNGSSVPLNPGQSTTFTLAFQPTAFGTYSQSLLVAHTATSQSSPLPIPIYGTCSGITVLSPQAGELLIINHPHPITWTSMGSTNVLIKYSTNEGMTWSTLPGYYPASGSTSWLVPIIDPSSHCVIRICDASTPQTYGESGIFTIGNGMLDILSPAGGETWEAGCTRNISWQSLNINQIIIDYSTDNGVTWLPINGGNNIKNASDGRCGWQIPANPSTQCKIRITDVSNPANQSQCMNFTILGFNVSDITLNVAPITSTLNSSVIANATITGTGSGAVFYKWKNEKADGSSHTESTAHSINLSNGQAIINSASDPFPLSTSQAALWKVMLEIVSPNSYEKTANYTISALTNLQIQVNMTSNSLLDILQTASFDITVTDGSGNPQSGATVEIFNNVYNNTYNVGPTGSDGKTSYSFMIPLNAFNGLYSITFKAHKNSFSDSGVNTQQLWVYHSINATGIKVIGCIQKAHLNPIPNTQKGFTIVAYIPQYINNKKIGARQLKIIQAGALYGYIDFARMGNSDFYTATFDDYSGIPNDFASWQIIATDINGNMNYFPGKYTYETTLALDYLHLNSAIVMNDGKNKYATADLLNTNSIQIWNNKACYLGIIQEPFNWTVQNNSSEAIIYPGEPVKIFKSKSLPFTFLPPFVPKGEFLGYSSMNPDDKQLIIFNRYGISGNLAPIAFSAIDLILRIASAKDFFNIGEAVPIFYPYFQNKFTDILQSKSLIDQSDILPILRDLIIGFIEVLGDPKTPKVREHLLLDLYTSGLLKNLNYDVVSFIIRDLLPVTYFISKGITLADIGFTVYDLLWPLPPVSFNGIQLNADNDTISITKTNGHFVEITPVNLAGVTSSEVIKGSTHSFSFHVTNVSQQKLYNLWVGLDILAWDYTDQKYKKIENTHTDYLDPETHETGKIDFSYYQSFDLEQGTSFDLSSLNYTFDQSVTSYQYHELSKPYYYMFTVWSNGEPGQKQPVKAEMLTPELIYKPFYIKDQKPSASIQLSKEPLSETDSAVFVYWNRPIETDIFQYHVLSDGTEIDVVDYYNQRTIRKKSTPQSICVKGENVSGILTTSNTIFVDPFPEYPSVYLSSPADGAFINSLTPLFDWYSSPNAMSAISYDLDISQDQSFQTTIYSSNSVQKNFILPSGILVYNNKYYWRARANYPGGHESNYWASTFSFFTVNYTPPNAPFNLTSYSSSKSALQSNSYVSIAWSDTNSIKSGFRVYRGTDTVNWAPVCVLLPDSLSYVDTTVLSTTRYYYKVTAFNLAGSSPPSNVASDSLPLGLPLPPMQIYPADSLVLACDFSPVFIWHSGSSQFLIQVSSDSLFSENFIVGSDSNILIKSYILPGNNLSNETRFYWRVKAKNQTGWGTFSAVRSFHTCLRTYRVSGHCLYDNSQHTPLHDIPLYLVQNGDTLFTTITDSLGYFAFSQVPNRTYSLKGNISIPPGGYNNTDAIKIRRHFSNLEPITSPIRLLAADVNNSGGINNTDAVKVRRRFANLDPAFARGDWILQKPTGGVDLSVSGSDVVQDIYVICVGDVNGSYIPVY